MFNGFWIHQSGNRFLPDGFARMLRTRTTNQAIVHGISEHKEARIVTKNQVNKQAQNGTPVIARSKKYLSYSDGPGIILFDHDKPRPLSIGSDAALKSYSPDALLDQLAKIHPAIAQAAHVATPSTSSCIYNATGDLLRGEGTGSHVYLFVKRASDIPRYLETSESAYSLPEWAGLNYLGQARPCSGPLLTCRWEVQNGLILWLARSAKMVLFRNCRNRLSRMEKCSIPPHLRT